MKNKYPKSDRLFGVSVTKNPLNKTTSQLSATTRKKLKVQTKLIPNYEIIPRKQSHLKWI